MAKKKTQTTDSPAPPPQGSIVSETIKIEENKSNISYVRLVRAVAPFPKTEPVYELKLESYDKKYIVEELVCDRLKGVDWKINGKTFWTPASNVESVIWIT